MCPHWDQLYPRSALFAVPFVGSDHTPLDLDSGCIPPVSSHRFRFDASWLEVDGFYSLVSSKLLDFLSSPHCSFGPLDDWRFCSRKLQQFLRGWAANRARLAMSDKSGLLEKIKSLDAVADYMGLDKAGWSRRYDLENELMNIYRADEVYWS